MLTSIFTMMSVTTQLQLQGFQLPIGSLVPCVFTVNAFCGSLKAKQSSPLNVPPSDEENHWDEFMNLGQFEPEI